MCELEQVLRGTQQQFAALFDEAPDALRVWARGRTIWCNAPLQYAAATKKPLDTCAQIMLAHAPACAALEAWQILPNGMLQTRYTKEFLVRQAKMLCQKERKIRVYDSSEPFFFEKCTAIRGRRMLRMAETCADERDLVLIAETMDMLCRPLKRQQIVQLAQRLDERLDENLKQHKREDLAAFVLLAVLEEKLTLSKEEHL